MGNKLYSPVRTRSFRLWLLLGAAGVGGIFPDIQKLWNGFQRGSWHSYNIPLVLLGISFTLILIGLAVSCRSRHNRNGLLEE